MIDQQTAEFTTLVDTLARLGVQPDADALALISKTLAKMFEADPDEAAVLRVNVKTKSLEFVIPQKLATIGSIPLSSATALAARTARERRRELVNNFGTSRHASVFEGVPLGRNQGEMIQKIMSAPILEGATVRGVVQISRKGQNTSDAGPDFTSKNLRTLASLSPTLERFLNLCNL